MTPAWDALPDEYRLERSSRGVLAVHRDSEPALQDAGFGVESEGRLRESELSGRRPMYELDVAEGDTLVLRRFTHGGLLRFLTRDRYLSPARPFDELALSERLRRKAVRTPRVVAARARRAPVFGWRLDLVSRRVPDALDLGAFVERVRAGRVSFPARRAVLEAAGGAVRALHDAGLYHADLNPKNLLVNRGALDGEVPEIWVLDLDRCALAEPLDDAARTDNLERLDRWVEKRDGRSASSLTRADRMRFLRAYEAGATKERWRKIAAKRARELGARRLGRLLESLFGGDG